MSFLHSWALIFGGAATVLPVAIHWLTRPSPRTLPLSTVRFVRQVIQQRRARQSLRDWLVLLLRILAVLMLAFLFARPFAGERPLISSKDSAEAARIVIVDASQSMAAAARGVPSFERARAKATDFLKPGNVRGNLIIAAAQPSTAFVQLSNNFRGMNQELAKAEALPERLNVRAALRKAGEMLASVPEGKAVRRELVIVSDFQRSNWSRADFGALPEGTLIQFESVSPKETPANLAVTKVRTRGRPEVGKDVRVEIEVGNYSKSPRQVRLAVTLEDATYPIEKLCAPRSRVMLHVDIPLRSVGWKTGEARLMGANDSLASDNWRPFTVHVKPKPRYVIITREAAGARHASSYYIETALDPSRSPAARKVTRNHTSAISFDTLSAADLIVIDHPGKLPAESIQLMASLLRRGRSILYIAAESADATNLKLLDDATGADLQLPVEFIPPPQSKFRRNLFLTEMDDATSPFNIFGDELDAAFDDLRFSGGLSSRNTETGLKDDLLATYSDRSACLVVSACGAGSLGILNAELTVSNLPASAAFVPFLAELTARLLGSHQTFDARPCGEPMTAFLPYSVSSIEGLNIDGAEDIPPGKLIEESTGVIWRWASAGPPRLYRVLKGEDAVFALCTATPAEESDLRPIDPDTLKTRLAAGRSAYFQSSHDQKSEDDHLWAWFGVACLICLVLEVGVLRGFRS